MTEPRGSFTGRTRRHQNRWKVHAADLAARWTITIGGIATIVAVLLVFAFLLSVVLPLFWPAARLTVVEQAGGEFGGRPLAAGLDEYQTLCWEVREDGELHVFRLESGETVSRTPLVDEGRITAVSASATGDDVVVGLENGSIRVGKVAVRTDFLSLETIPAELAKLSPGESTPYERGIAQRTMQGQWRVQQVDVEFGPAWSVATRPIEQLDHVSPAADGLGAEGPTILIWADGAPRLITTKRNDLTGELRRRDDHPLPVPSGWSETPFRVLLTGRGDNVYLVSVSGQLARLETRDPAAARVVELVPLVERGRRLTMCQWVLGRDTLLCGDDQGHVTAWFRVPTVEAGGSDGWSLVAAHRLPAAEAAQGAAVTAGDSSQRSRLVAVGSANGILSVYHVTAERLVAQARIPSGAAIQAVTISPKDDGFAVWDGRRVWKLDFDARYPEVSWGTLFQAVWYEGYEEPQHIWQSSFAGVEPEPKLGLLPLVFGTIKATLYSMLFGAPIALLAAVYASEFMSPRLRAQAKPVIEMMASLPSVVLGFLAALVLAPIVEMHLASLLGIVLLVPALQMLGAQLWQLLPSHVVPYVTPYRLIAIGVTFFLAIVAGIAAGPVLERWLFAGSISRWLDGQVGTAVSGWFLLLLPVTVVLTALACGSLVNPWMRQRWGHVTRTRFASLNLLKFLLGVVAACGLAWGGGMLLAMVGFDPRGSLVDTYVQRNALIVGFVMGFAIIPLIFTIADDALSTVPQHLRSASLGAGATPWQTAVRVVIPTAMSGLFSAVMIGLGRAVGETMIVLMAGGNTPIMEWNIFNGVRTLSANIAVELPEAVRDSSHYRTLFLAALTLFLLTFVVNTAAELVRIRFRKRAYQL